MTKLPGAIFLVDVKKEHIAIDEARKLRIPVYAIVDTNVDPDLVDYPIPANDDAVKSIEIVTKVIADAVIEGTEVAKEKRMEEPLNDGNNSGLYRANVDNVPSSGKFDYYFYAKTIGGKDAYYPFDAKDKYTAGK